MVESRRSVLYRNVDISSYRRSYSWQFFRRYDPLFLNPTIISHPNFSCTLFPKRNACLIFFLSLSSSIHFLFITLIFNFSFISFFKIRKIKIQSSNRSQTLLKLKTLFADTNLTVNCYVFLITRENSLQLNTLRLVRLVMLTNE